MLTILLACTGSTTPTEPPVTTPTTGDSGSPTDRVGRWLAGDLHVHSSVGSNDTDGLGTPDVLGAAMDKAGLSFLFLTDHSNSMGSMDCPTGDVEDCPNQGPELPAADWPEGVFLASEISPVHSLDFTQEPTGHTLCLPLNSTSFPKLDHFEDRPPGKVTGGQGVAQCKDAGGLAIVAHPFAIAQWIQYDWTSEDFDGMEVYNGTVRFDAWDERGVAAWEERVAEGRRVVPVGGSDCHRWGTEAPGTVTDPPLGWPTTWVYVFEDETVVQAIAAGRVTIAEPGTTLAITASSEARTVQAGQQLRGPATVTARATTAERDRVLQLKQANGAVLAEVALEPGVQGELELPVDDGLVYARVWHTTESAGPMTAGIALTNVIAVNAF